ncbi:MAG: DUF2207 domain-containing protein [Ancrocorticia sp.]
MNAVPLTSSAARSSATRLPASVRARKLLTDAPRGPHGVPAAVAAPRLLRLTVAFALLLVAMTSLFTVPARADDITRVPNFDVTAHLDDGGALAVRFDVTVDFPDERHGIFFVLPTAQRREGDHYQLYDVEFGDVTMDGGPVPAEKFRDGDVASLRIGDSDITVTGQHSYSMEFTVRGVARPGQRGGEDILPWDIITPGAYSDWSIEDFSLTLTGPAGAEFSCTRGDEGSNTPCEGILAGDGSYSAHVAGLDDGGVTAKLSWPAGTLNVPAPTVVYREPAAVRYGFSWPVVTGGLAAIGLAFAAAIGLVRRDERYAGLPVGVYPRSRDHAAIELSSKHPLVVRFDPPEMAPEQAGVALTKMVDDGDVLATVIISLAQRGYLQIIEYEDPLGTKRDAPEPTNWMLCVRRAPDEFLTPWEADFLTAIADPATGEDQGMKKRERLDEVQWRQSLAKEGFDAPERPGTRLRQINDRVAQDLITAATADVMNAWVLPPARSPLADKAQVAAWFLAFAGAGLIVAGFIAYPTVGVGVALLLAGLLLALGCMKSKVFSADGSVAHEQARGYQLYLKKAEIGQLQEAERAQLFINTLPWAISLGVVAQWSKIADEVLDSREDVDWEPFWWSASYGYMYPGHVGDQVGSFSEAAGTAAHMKGAAKAYSEAASAVSSSSAGGGGSVGGGSFGSGGGSW